MAPRPLPHAHQMAPYNGTSTGTTSTAPCNGPLMPRPICQSGSSPPSPPIGSKNPIAIAIWGTIAIPHTQILLLFDAGKSNTESYKSSASILLLSFSKIHIGFSYASYFLWTVLSSSSLVWPMIISGNMRVLTLYWYHQIEKFDSTRHLIVIFYPVICFNDIRKNFNFFSCSLRLNIGHVSRLLFLFPLYCWHWCLFYHAFLH